MQERIAAMIENDQREVEDIDQRIAALESDISRLRERRLLIEEEAVEARVTLNFLQYHHLRVERNADGIFESSVDPVEEPA